MNRKILKNSENIQKRMKKSYCLLILSVYFSITCVSSSPISHNSQLLHLSFKNKEYKNIFASSIPSKEEDIVLFPAPDQSGIPSQKDWSEKLGVQSVEMEVISQWDDPNRYHLIVRFTNPSSESVNANLNLYAYDRLGRLVRTQFGGSISFRPKSVMTREYSFSKGGREVRWILSLTGKK